MSARRRVLLLWTVLGTLVVVTAAVLWMPMGVAWRCYWLHENAARAETELVKKLEDGTLALVFTTGPQRDQACTARTSPAHFEAAQPGDPMEVVYFEDRPGECVLAATVENSGLLLWSLGGVLLFGLLLVVGLGLWLQRMFTAPQGPRMRMRVERGSVRCPACAKPMAEGYVPLLAGIHWREIGEPVGLPHALSGLPGTVGWRERPRLHAFRCDACEIVTFQYGVPSDHGSATGPASPPSRTEAGW